MNQTDLLFLKAVVTRPAALEGIAALLHRRDRLPELLEEALFDLFCEEYDDDGMGRLVQEYRPDLMEFVQRVYDEELARISRELNVLWRIANAQR